MFRGRYHGRTSQTRRKKDSVIKPKQFIEEPRGTFSKPRHKTRCLAQAQALHFRGKHIVWDLRLKEPIGRQRPEHFRNASLLRPRNSDITAASRNLGHHVALPLKIKRFNKCLPVSNLVPIKSSLELIGGYWNEKNDCVVFLVSIVTSPDKIVQVGSNNKADSRIGSFSFAKRGDVVEPRSLTKHVAT